MPDSTIQEIGIVCIHVGLFGYFQGINKVCFDKPKTSRRKRVELQVSKASGGVLPGVDLNRSSDLEEVMNEP